MHRAIMNRLKKCDCLFNGTRENYYRGKKRIRSKVRRRKTKRTVGSRGCALPNVVGRIHRNVDVQTRGGTGPACAFHKFWLAATTPGVVPTGPRPLLPPLLLFSPRLAPRALPSSRLPTEACPASLGVVAGVAGVGGPEAGLRTPRRTPPPKTPTFPLECSTTPAGLGFVEALDDAVVEVDKTEDTE